MFEMPTKKNRFRKSLVCTKGCVNIENAVQAFEREKNKKNAEKFLKVYYEAPWICKRALYTHKHIYYLAIEARRVCMLCER